MFDKTRQKLTEPIHRAVTLAVFACIIAMIALIAGLARHAR